MGVTRTSEEAKKHNIQLMGVELGEVYSELWQELWQVHKLWFEYLELFGPNDKRIQLLNDTTPRFFSMIQRLMQEEVILHIARVTDNVTTISKKNLTFKALPELVPEELKVDVEQAVTEAVDRSDFCRDWRHRRLAHRDLAHSLDGSASPLNTATREGISAAINSMDKCLNVTLSHFEDTETRFHVAPDGIGAHGLIRILWYGRKAGEETRQSVGKVAFEKIEWPPDDL